MNILDYIIKLTELFLNTVEKETFVSKLPEEVTKFFDEHSSEFYKLDAEFEELQYYYVISFIEHRYNRFINKNINRKSGVIDEFELESATNFITLIKEYFSKNNYGAQPNCFAIIVYFVANMLVRDQNLYKYSVELSNESQKKLDDFSSIIKRESESFADMIQESTNYFDRRQFQTRKEFASLEKDLNEAHKKLQDDTKKEMNKTEKNMIQTSIAILGVFSAVVLTFNMGISFAADALEVFMKSSVYHSVLVIVLFGFIIGNVLFALFAYLRHIHVPDAKEKIKETLLGKIILVFNSVLLFFCIANIICWALGAVEGRDNCIANKYPVTETTMQEDTTIYDRTTEFVIEQSE